MADQSISVTSLPDSGSRAAVALRMANFIWNEEWTDGRKFARADFLNLYCDCFGAAAGIRPK